MRRLAVMALALLCLLAVKAQNATKGDFTFNFYGQVRADVFYNSRANNETVDGLFYLYPKDHAYDADGNDLNAGAQGNMYVISTRLGVDISGPKIGSAMTTAKIEADFRGTGSTLMMLRLRHAYVNMQWQRASVLVGQTWHPLFGEVSPSMLNMSTGSPFQPFNRSPQIRMRYKAASRLQITAAAVWQQQYASAGPDGKTTAYIKNSCIPELYLGIDYKARNWQAGVGAEMLSLRPRTKANVDGMTYKVDERATSVSVEAHAKYVGYGWMVSGKTALANNLTHCQMLGGFAVTSIDSRTGECEYTPFRHSMTWVNVVYGTKWQPGLFVGYLKNLGTGKAIAGDTYGVGLDVDQLMSVNMQMCYCLPNWKVGVELEPSTAWYGTVDKCTGNVVDTHHVTNWRILASLIYSF